jgi:hypothetical protein
MAIEVNRLYLFMSKFATVIDRRYNFKDAREHGIQFEPGRGGD